MSATRPTSVGHVGGCGCSEPSTRAADHCYCTVEDLVRAIARKHALSVLNAIGGRGRARFSDVEEALPGIGPSTLSETLRLLRQVGLVEREVFPETPPRVEYALTEAGSLLRERFHELLERVRETGRS